VLIFSGFNGKSTKDDASTSITGFSIGIGIFIKKPIQQAAITAEKEKPNPKTLTMDSNLRPWSQIVMFCSIIHFPRKAR
jgi:hypothetical protein